MKSLPDMNYLRTIFTEVDNMQIEAEFVPTMEFLLNRGIHNVLEIGSGQGLSMFGWASIATGKKIAVDLPAGPYAGRGPAEIAYREKVWKEHFGDEVVSILADSQLPETIESVRKELNGETVDFLFIDGNHQYPYVKNDFYNYKQFVSPNGIIGFHDINDTPHHRSFGVTVCDVWKEIDSFGEKIEFTTKQHWAGIGLLVLSE